jgi:hypothetical protein
MSCDDSDEECSDACYAADDYPPGPNGLGCQACVILRLLQCFDTEGCGDAVQALMCCLEANCFGNDDDECAERECDRELQTAIVCGVNAAPQCLDNTGFVGACFELEAPDPEVDGGA